MRRIGALRSMLRVTGVVGLGVLALAAMMALLAPAIAPYDPLSQDLALRLLPPAWDPMGDPRHLLGTDALGRDMLSRIMYGARVSLSVPTAALISAAAAGTALGLIAGFYGGFVDTLIMRIVDVQLAFPFLLLAIAVIAVLPPSLFSVIFVLAVTGWVLYARIVRGQVLSLKNQEWVIAAKTIGCGDRRILFGHLLPNVIPTVIVLVTIQAAVFVVAESALSYLGLGAPQSTPSWGSMMNDGKDYLTRAWWILTLPGLAIVVVVSAAGLVGDWARDVLDPRLRNIQ